MTTNLPNSIEEAVSQSVIAVKAALAAGHTRIQTEMVYQELKPPVVAYQFLQEYTDIGENIKVFFPDAGAAALAKRDWEDIPHMLKGIKELLEPVAPDDGGFVLVGPTPSEVEVCEQVANEAGDRPYILLNPKLQDISVIGIGYAGRQLRERFLSTLETAYYLCPLQGGLVYRCYPGSWQVYSENEDGGYELLRELDSRPTSDDLDAAFAPLMPPEERSGGLFRSLGQFLKSLSS